VQFAIDASGERVLPHPKGKAICPGCGAPVIAKCGEIVMWHWSHLTKDCDPWYEPESIWHRQWKEHFPEEWREVVIGKHRADVQTPRGIVEFQASSISSSDVQERENFYGKMIWVVKADTFDLTGQLSPAASCFYSAALHKSIGSRPRLPEGNLFDLLEIPYPGQSKEEYEKTRAKREKEYEEAAAKLKIWESKEDAIWRKSWLQDPMYKWRWPRTTWGFAKKKIYLDLGKKLFGITWMSPDCKIIKGSLWDKERFIAKLLA
jgi:hypothetical protein